MKTSNPQIIRLRAELSEKDLPSVAQRVLRIASDVGMGSAVAFESPLGAKAQAMARLDLTKLVRSQVRFSLESGAHLSLSSHGAGSLLQGSRSQDSPLSEDEVRASQARQSKLVEALLEAGMLVSGHVERLEEGLDAVPSVPLARRLVSVAVTAEQVEQAYREPQAFWAAWGARTKAGELHLLSRHLDVASTADWFRAIFEDQWAMARAARPGDTFFGGKVVPDGCEELLMRGKGRLSQVGYRDGVVQLAGFVPEGEHVPPWEILTWSEVLSRGSLDDGSPVSELVIVFRNEAMARREATPLLDMGAKVAFMGRDGLFHDVT
jgi:hypothetical protein